jgi:hypothetical protein
VLYALDEQAVQDGMVFYASFFNAPPAIRVSNHTFLGSANVTSGQALLHGMIGVGLVGLLSKLHRWTESAMYFDGSSLGA